MNGVRQGWLVTLREMRERSRSRAFIASVVLMIVTVAAMLLLPDVFKPGGTRDVGLTGAAPPGLATTIQSQAHAAGITARIHRYPTLAAGEKAVRQGHADVLVAGTQRLEWTGRADEQLKTVVVGAIQLVAVRERAAAAGIAPGALVALLAPVRVSSVQLGRVTGRSPADETAVIVMTGVLLFCISVFGSMVLTGVLEEKASRVVEVLLARIPARTLLAGKITGIGLLGLAQIGVTALVAFVAVTAVRASDIPAVRGGVLAWVLVWFVLGYALYATMYGALGSLGSRAEDAQSVAGPAMIILVAAYFASFTMLTQPASALARAVSYFPLTAPMAMPGRIAMGAAAWWEPVAAAALTLATIAGLVQLAGRVYTNAILHSGPRLSLRDAWQGEATHGPRPEQARTGPRRAFLDRARALTGRRAAPAQPGRASPRVLITILTGIGVVIGIAVAVARDVILGAIVAVMFITITTQIAKRWTHHPRPPAARH